SVSRELLQLAGRKISVRGHEGLPRTLLEALAYGLPAVASGVAGVPEIVVDGENGFVVPPGNPAAMAEALASLASNRELRERMGAAGRKRAQTVFSTSSSAEAMLALYHQLATRHSF